MKIKILAGEYIFGTDGFSVFDERGFAIRALEDMEIEIENEEQIPVIQTYQDFVRPKPEPVAEPVAEPAEEPVAEPVAEPVEEPIANEGV